MYIYKCVCMYILVPFVGGVVGGGGPKFTYSDLQKWGIYITHTGFRFSYKRILKFVCITLIFSFTSFHFRSDPILYYDLGNNEYMN